MYMCLFPSCVAPAVIRESAVQRTLSTGSQLVLICTGVSHGILTLSWYFNNSLVILHPSKSMIVGDPSSSLTLTVMNLTYADAGNYTCVASNLAGNTSQNNSLQVTGELCEHGCCILFHMMWGFTVGLTQR